MALVRLCIVLSFCNDSIPDLIFPSAFWRTKP
jgi:hypothetical protein